MINTMLVRSLIFNILLFLSFNAVAEQKIKIFKPESYQQLLSQHKNKSFILVLWSLDCPPCYKELAMLAEEVKKRPSINLVLVSTDSVDDSEEIQHKLAGFGFKQANAWVFDNEQAQQLRYEIDPNWYGELPRSYLFDAEHNRRAISGVLQLIPLQRWIVDG